ncbi:MAG TPA: Rieske (2Fe-2S) protein [Burkholderiaceae bacterium]|jgi:nitrite reductase/ring-hydroxylating ferredoxin subunit|nr:Rieske (2Fe-2S) protein [Burkholderiaceae bacterium]
MPQAAEWVRVCESSALAEGGDGVRFVTSAGEPAFAVRSAGIVRAYVNRCTHVGVELDWIAGKFFDESGRSLLCSVHGATYAASDGRCEGGPCRGRGLQPVRCREHDGWIWIEGRKSDD